MDPGSTPSRQRCRRGCSSPEPASEESAFRPAYEQQRRSLRKRARALGFWQNLGDGLSERRRTCRPAPHRRAVDRRSARRRSRRSGRRRRPRQCPGHGRIVQLRLCATTTTTAGADDHHDHHDDDHHHDHHRPPRPPPPRRWPGRSTQPIAPPLDQHSAENNPQLGRIAIPKIGLDSELHDGIRLTTLDRGPGHWPGSAMPGQIGNVVVAGHRTSHGAEFRHLDALAPGDDVMFTTADGTFTYHVTGRRSSRPTRCGSSIRRTRRRPRCSRATRSGQPRNASSSIWRCRLDRRHSRVTGAR